MRFTIGARIFFALTAVSLLTLTLNAAVTRWNFQRGFLEYVAEQELDAIDAAALDLATLYRQTGGWQEIRNNPRRWNELLRQSNGAAPGGPPPGRPPPRGGPPPEDPFEFGRRISLVDADGGLVMGRPAPGGATKTVPVTVDDVTVGYVSIAPRRQLTDEIDRKFAEDQSRSIYVIALAALVLAALISALLARQLTRPIRSLAGGARAISAGDYDTRIPERRNDELGDLAREFNSLASTLEKDRVARRQWVADIAHELRTPLAVLKGELDAIEDGIRSYDTASQRSLQDEVSRLSDLVGELHDLSVYDEGGQDFRLETVDVTAVLSDVLAGAANRLAGAGIDLERQLPGGRIEINADAVKLERVFLNLIENTLRYTDAPGTLAVSCTEDADEAIIEFADSAPGVSPEARDRLFDRLFRVDVSRSRDTGGSGLGLAICKAIVERHHGRIVAGDSPLGGILMQIHLPKANLKGPLA